MNVLSLFSGIGGLELGLERAGMTVVGQVEIDPYCRRVLAKHWPEVPRHDDVRTTVEWWLGTTRPRVDVVCGGFPCQPVSLAGKGLAQADARWLWPAAWAVIRDLRPRFAILENVPGLLARGLGDVLGDLAAGGYDAEWDCVPAAAVGAPHRRDRVFIVAHSGGVGCRQGPGQLGGLGAPGRGTPMADAESNGRRQGRPGRPACQGSDGAGLAPAQLADPAGARWRSETRDAVSDDGGRPLAERQAGPRRRSHDVADAASNLRRAPRHDGPTSLDWRRPERRHQWATEPDVGRVAYGIPARVDRLRALGNAVVPQVAEHIGRLVMEAAA